MPLPTHTNRPKFAVCTLTAMRAASDLRPLRSRYEISGPLEYHIQTFPSSLYVGPFIFKPVFICIFTVHADENWLENAWNHIQGRRNDLNMLLLRSTNYMSAPHQCHNIRTSLYSNVSNFQFHVIKMHKDKFKSSLFLSVCLTVTFFAQRDYPK